MFNLFKGFNKKEEVIEKKIFGITTRVEVVTKNRKGNIIETRKGNKDDIKRNNEKRKPVNIEEKLEMRNVLSTEEKLEMRKNNKKKVEEVKKKETNKINKLVLATGVATGVVVSSAAYSVSRYDKVVKRDELETKDTLNLEDINDILKTL